MQSSCVITTDEEHTALTKIKANIFTKDVSAPTLEPCEQGSREGVEMGALIVNKAPVQEPKRLFFTNTPTLRPALRVFFPVCTLL